VCYGQSEIVHGVLVQCKKGEVLAIMGRNGMGQDNAYESIDGPAAVEIWNAGFGWRKLGKLESFKRVKQGLAYVPTGPHGLPNMSVTDNIPSRHGAIKTGKYQRISTPLFPF